MTKRTAIENFAPIGLRDTFRQKIFANQAGWFLGTSTNFFPISRQNWWCQYPAQTDFMTAYFRLLTLGANWIDLETKKVNSTVTYATDGRPLVYVLMEQDILRVILPVAVTAWLTVDDFRWHHHVSEIPEDLQYGLVLSYPNLLVQYAAFIAGYNREKILNFIPQSIQQKCERQTVLAIHRIMAGCPHHPRQLSTQT